MRHGGTRPPDRGLGMSRSIAAMHVAKKQLGLDDDTYRAALVQVTGKSSSADMSEAQRQDVLEHFRQRGFNGSSTARRKPLEGKFAGKLQALWIAGWNLGLVRDRDDRALVAFVKRQTGIDHVRFLRHGQDAMKAIEALKGWLERAGGVDWKAHEDPADCVLQAQVRRLKVEWERNRNATTGLPILIDAVAGDDISGIPSMSAATRQATMNTLGERIRSLPGG